MSHHDLEKINALLTRAGAVAAGRVDWFAVIDSTNTWLLRQPDAHARVCIAEWQSAGRGRRGRVWSAPASGAVLLSVGWRMPSAAGGGLSLVSGLAALDALRKLGVDCIGLKWPNDVVAVADSGDGGGDGGGDTGDGAATTVIGKLGGILTELNGDRGVIGMGINVAAATSPTPALSPSPTPSPTPSPSPTSSPSPSPSPSPTPSLSPTPSPSPESPHELSRIDLHSLGFRLDRDRLAAELIISHCDYLRRFCAAGLPAFVDEWNAAHAYRDRSVTVKLPAESLQGVARGIDVDGALLIDCTGARRRVFSGEATLRAVDSAA